MKTASLCYIVEILRLKMKLWYLGLNAAYMDCLLEKKLD